MRIIGIHDGHNASACLLEDGVITAAVQEERLSRVKNHDVFPARAVAWLLGRAGCGWEGIDAVAMGGAASAGASRSRGADRSHSPGRHVAARTACAPCRACYPTRARLA